MPMTKEEHEALLEKLLNPDLEHSERTDILQQLRGDYTEVLTEYSQLTETTEKLKAKNDDLIVANSKLFRQVGVEGQSEEKKKEEEQLTFSQTVTLESFEK